MLSLFFFCFYTQNDVVFARLFYKFEGLFRYLRLWFLPTVVRLILKPLCSGLLTFTFALLYVSVTIREEMLTKALLFIALLVVPFREPF